MSSGLEERVTAIEERLRTESGLRAAGDRDLGEMAQTVRAQHHLIQALSITQSQHTELLRAQGDAIDALQRDHGAKLEQVTVTLGLFLARNRACAGVLDGPRATRNGTGPRRPWTMVPTVPGQRGPVPDHGPVRSRT